MFLIALTIFLVATAASAEKKNYHGYQVLRTSPLTEDQAQFLDNLMLTEPQLDFWKFPSPGFSAEIMVDPGQRSGMTNLLTSKGIQFEVKIDDVQSLAERSAVRKANRAENSNYELNFDQYPLFEEVVDFLDSLASNYDFVETERLNKTAEDRDIVAIKITKGGPGKPNIFLDGTAHAREWISTSVVAYLVHELVENYEAHPEYLDNFNIYAIPVVNPDGYAFSHVDDRMWRKTRTQHYSSSCPGVDLNRNFPFKFGGAGSSSNPCDAVFRGDHGFSEPESHAVGKLFSSLEEVPVLALTYHSAFDSFLYSYGYATDAFPENVDENIELCEEAMYALNEVHGQNFVCIHSAGFYPTGGITDDWYKHEGSRFAYCPELRDNGYGFLLPPEFILPSGEENWAALKVMLDKVMP